MLMAGLYDVANLEGISLSSHPFRETLTFCLCTGEKEPLYTFTVVTTDAIKDLAWLHDRQPVILSTKEEIDTWLDTSSQSWTDKLTNIVKPYSNNGSPLDW